MTTNPILDELHAVREQLLADAGGTLEGLVAKIEADQKGFQPNHPQISTNNPMHMHRNGEVVQFAS